MAASDANVDGSSPAGGTSVEHPERATLVRRQITVQLAPAVSVRVKVLEQADGVRVKPEYDDVLAAATARLPWRGAGFEQPHHRATSLSSRRA